MTIVYGTVGYVFLKSNKYNINILLLSDIHSKLDYCTNFVQVSEWLQTHMNKINILLEEVSREDFKLNELWSTSDHTIKLKNLFLNNSELIHDIDIRPYLIPFSWEFLEKHISNIDKSKTDMKFKDYLCNINLFLYLRLDKIKNKIPNIYNKKQIKKYGLNIELNKIREEFKLYIIKNAKLMDTNISDIVKSNKDILFKYNDLLNSCMEWFTIVKIYDLKIKNNKNFIIHTGLYHCEKISEILQNQLNYSVISTDGVNDIDSAEIQTSIKGCLKIPDHITKTLSETSN